ncbi:MAG: translation initiation factor IF-2 [Spiroplasma poulsonii]|uniref:Translation initiation factor IF-2 n=1 Tax=Spiroplasma poulsonii TaxID=2138 RepID=A0A2P6FF25_9MOLU|nr:translation initiation factor IF-2 [Spiroplasma poulsonii]KAF0850407.1 Translation initiation factor IF-2 [Spiroplasma poulsonii]MBW1242248.1 translation initiation factor IF-2 [Spiroplasma poulsonii]PQM32050.1 Translation initiation factor IF-2 [Spiroplasma poulsonii]PWF94531.1 Translation initiation factor IF-2 [Spiroplasma poulsonii]PWF94687.1 Translation initiation factor IF-2 [Spiroplasma poulsonii]
MNNQKNNKSNKKSLAKNQRHRIQSQLKTVEAHINEGVFVYAETLTIAEFAEKISKPVSEIIKYFFAKGIMLNQNTYLNEDQLGELCLEFGLDFKREKSVTHENLIESFEVNDDDTSLEKRPPIVTIMGHVDHGKTTLLDTIRNTNVVSTEHGGITQHIGAYQIKTKNNEKITFVDTPGHEAFTQMRARGSAVTDIVVLVVAADDGVMLQTKEAIDHAKAAGVPIIVFINKIDKVGANLDNVMMQLSQEDLTPEEWGGTVSYVKGSAKQNQGIDELLDTILLMADLMELKANPNRFALGTVIESHLDRGLGPVATLLVQSGTLNIKDALVAGCTFGYVRDLSDESGKKIKTAEPSTPVIIYGLNEVPNAGDRFMVFRDEKLAREIALKRKATVTINKRYKNQVFSLESLSEQIKDGQLKQINIILKADTQGTVEAVKSSLQKINIVGVKINVLRATVGAISESDVTLGLASQAFIVGFNVRPTSHVRKKVEDEGVEIRLHTIIYKLTEEIIAAAEGMLDPEMVEEVLGQAEVRQIFHHSDIGTIAGCHVTDGVIPRKSRVRILRDGVIVYDGELASLKYVKDDIKEAKVGAECGLTIKNYNDLKEQDVIEAYIEKAVTK